MKLVPYRLQCSLALVTRALSAPPVARSRKADGRRYRCKEIGSYARAQELLRQGHAYLDGDGDGRRDLFGSLDDVFASVANYFVAHGWQAGEPVVALARADEGADPFKPEGLEARYSLAELGEKGYRPAEALGHDHKATLVTLEGSDGTEHWFGFQNFYTITRYNRSPMYAMAVYQLSREIAAGAVPAVAPATAWHASA